jgi:hypothetical protein
MHPGSTRIGKGNPLKLDHDPSPLLYWRYSYAQPQALGRCLNLDLVRYFILPPIEMAD